MIILNIFAVGINTFCEYSVSLVIHNVVDIINGWWTTHKLSFFLLLFLYVGSVRSSYRFLYRFSFFASDFFSGILFDFSEILQKNELHTLLIGNEWQARSLCWGNAMPWIVSDSRSVEMESYHPTSACDIDKQKAKAQFEFKLFSGGLFRRKYTTSTDSRAIQRNGIVYVYRTFSISSVQFSSDWIGYRNGMGAKIINI